MNHKKLNIIIGWMVFAIATVVYFMTLEETTSLWDCGEYITTAYKLEVGHPPGAPLFMMLGRLFSMFTSPENAAYMINAMSGLSSSFTILFLFWTITLFGKKIALKDGGELTSGRSIAIIGSGMVGALAYTFTDSFWFSAVEGEVYAMASLFTAIVFWAILKWDDEVRTKKAMLQETGKSSLRWIILIMFVLGLAIGVHLLGLLAIPALAYVIYFNYSKNVNLGGIILTGVIGVFALGFIQEGIIPGTVKIASLFERSFVNSFGMPFNTGTIVFFILLLTLIVVGLYITKKKNSPIWNAVVLSFGVLMIGYSCFAMIVIRSNENTPLDENNPENLVTLHSYLMREQYGKFPLLYGEYFNSARNSRKDFTDGTPTYLRRFVVIKKGKDVKGFETKAAAEQYVATSGGKITEKYYMTADGKEKWATYKQNTLFPRMYATQIPAHKVTGYKKWSGYADNLAAEKKSRKRSKNKGNIGSDGNRVPTFGENISYFMSYQVNFMYWRYFMWNFSGRQNDIQGHGDIYNGNWQTGFNFIDSERIGDQSTAPNYTANNPSNNKFFLLPLILGIIGMMFHFFRAKKDAFVVLLLFFFTGLAIVVYLNQKPMEPRERDYAYAGSFYAFAIWIGLSVFALYEAAKNMSSKKWLVGLAGFGALALVFTINGLASSDYSLILIWLMMGMIGGGMILIMTLLKNSDGKLKGIVAICLTIIAPIIMGVQGWDDHDRSERTTAKDLAYNYLVGCGPNGILFANGDNDTFPLWYLQEVEGYKKDVRVSNLSLLGTDWYTQQMTFRTYDSDPLPIHFTEDQYRMSEGYLDQVMFYDATTLMQNGWDAQRLNGVYGIIEKQDPAAFKASYSKIAKQVQRVVLGAQPSANIAKWARDLDSTINTKSYSQFVSEFSAQVAPKLAEEGKITQEQYSQTIKLISLDNLPPVNIKEVSAFMRDENNVSYVQQFGQNMLIVPFTNIFIPVDKDTVAKYNYVPENQLDRVVDKITFKLNGTLMKDDIMMLETIAHNDWKRTIQFTSPGGSEVTDALRNVGHVVMEGMVYKLTPSRLPGIQGYGYVDIEQLYENLMVNYKYGEIKQGVLVDYYTRRHTNSYRMQFYVAAKAYVELSDRFIQQKASIETQLESLESMAETNPMMAMQISQGKEQLKQVNQDLALVEDAYTKAGELINKSLEELPIGDVIEFGDLYSRNYLPKYIEVLYAINADNKEEVATQIIDLIEGQMEHFLSLKQEQLLGSKQELATVQADYLDIYNFVVKYDADGAVANKLEGSFKSYENRFGSIMSDIQKGLKGLNKDERKKGQEQLQFLASFIAEFQVGNPEKALPIGQ